MRRGWRLLRAKIVPSWCVRSLLSLHLADVVHVVAVEDWCDADEVRLEEIVALS